MSLLARTHLAIERRLSGEPLEIEEGRARVALDTTGEMAADSAGLVHGGFVFSLADYCAMLTVNEPNVVLASAEVKFLRPSRIGDRLVATGEISAADGDRYSVDVTVRHDDRAVALGSFRCVVPSRHVLEAGR